MVTRLRKTKIRTLSLGHPKGTSYPAHESQKWPIYQRPFSHENLFAHYHTFTSLSDDPSLKDGR